MPHPCVVCGRSRMNPNNREEEYMFFGFPVNDEARCGKWLEFCCREDLYKLTKKQLLQRMVCSKHFDKKDFLNDYYDRLNCNAVPTVYDPKQSLYNITCVLCGNFRKDPPEEDFEEVTFHHFPGEEFRCLEWLDFVGVDSYYRLTRKEILFCYICSKHFDSSQFMDGYKNRLTDNAVPNIRFSNHEGEETFIMELISEKEVKVSEKTKKLDPLPAVVLESQACAACGRSRSDPRNKVERYKFHPFPAYEIGRCLRWCQFLGREDILKMSPNQIRKLVLCSKHFQTGQNFHNIGPCDAVPTIRDIHELTPEEALEQMEMENEDIDDACNKVGKRGSRPLVSSKKPKVDNKPAPLAKKRGKSRRPTSINIPKPEPVNFETKAFIKKLPIPASTNWNFQFANSQFKPIAIGNNVTQNLPNNISTDIKKVILPFTGDISKLGAPIPVHSLSSIPPGLLIKINLPDQGTKVTKSGRGRGRGRGRSRGRGRKAQSETRHEIVNNGDITKCVNVDAEKLEPIRKFEPEEIELDEDSVRMSDLLSFSTEEVVEELVEGDIEIHEEVILPEENFVEHQTEMKREIYFDEIEEEPKEINQTTSKTRRTLLPIRKELYYFLRKLKPQLQKLPKNSRAKVKLAIVNKVIDFL